MSEIGAMRAHNGCCVGASGADPGFILIGGGGKRIERWLGGLGGLPPEIPLILYAEISIYSYSCHLWRNNFNLSLKSKTEFRITRIKQNSSLLVLI